MMAPDVSISVYSRPRRVIRRWKTRQCRSVQSIIGATENNQLLDFSFFLCTFSYLDVVLEEQNHRRFPPILAHYCLFFASEYNNVVRLNVVLYRRVVPKRQPWGQLMGTIVARKRKDGTTAHLAQLVVKRNGLIVHREARTFDRKQAAAAWLEKREGELATPGALNRLA